MAYPEAPARIDLLTRLSGVSLDEILQSREKGQLAEFTVDFLGKEIFIKTKGQSVVIKILRI